MNDLKQFQKRVDALVSAMLAKAMREPEAAASLRSNDQPQVMLRWKDARRDWLGSDTSFEFLRADSLAEALDKADAFVAKQPDAEERRMHEFMGALGKVIDLGRESGIDSDFINPLEIQMKKLSENIITDQRKTEAA